MGIISVKFLDIFIRRRFNTENRVLTESLEGWRNRSLRLLLGFRDTLPLGFKVSLLEL